jgi:hypothetical protein
VSGSRALGSCPAAVDLDDVDRGLRRSRLLCLPLDETPRWRIERAQLLRLSPTNIPDTIYETHEQRLSGTWIARVNGTAYQCE